jgi:hypothetical protein
MNGIKEITVEAKKPLVLPDEVYELLTRVLYFKVFIRKPYKPVVWQIILQTPPERVPLAATTDGQTESTLE